MITLTESPFVMLAVSLVTLSLCASIGAQLLGRRASRTAEAEADFRTVLAACLTLLGLLIGFSFSMATSRYDLRKSYEAAEASAISTAYLRTDFMEPADAQKTRQLLRTYLAQRILFFSNRDADKSSDINGQIARLQGELWSAVRDSAAAQAQPNVLTSLLIASMNDVLSSEGNTQAAWWNRIPTAAWMLMGLIAIVCNTMMGFSARHLWGRASLFVLPLAISIAFFLISDIDSPDGGGLIHIAPQDLLSLREGLR